MRSEQLIQILTDTFEHNHSVDFLTNGDARKRKNLMAICLQAAQKTGQVHHNEKAVALSFFPDKPPSTLQQVRLKLAYIFKVFPASKIPLIQERDTYIKQQLPKEKCWHIYFIGVEKSSKRNGYGKALLEQIEQQAALEKRIIILETSNPESLKFYQRLGFTVYHEWTWSKVDFTLWFLKKEWKI